MLALRVTGIYIVIASLWILFSDKILAWFISDIDMYMKLQTYKGGAFVLITGSLLYLYLAPRIKKLNESQKNLVETEKSLEQRLEYELATVECMHLLLEPGSMDEKLPRILDVIHETVKNSRSYIFKNEDNTELGLCMSQVYEVVSEGIEPQIDNSDLQHLPYSEGAPTLLHILKSKQHFAQIVEELDDPERNILSEQGILSVLIIPIFAGSDFWGFIGFDDCTEMRKWHEDDINLLEVIANGIGESIYHRKAEDELKDSEERFKALHNASFGGITIHDKGLILDCNQGLSDITGYSLEELIGMNGLLLIAESSRSMVMNNILSGYEEPYEAMGCRKDGTEYSLRLQAKNIPYKGKKVRVVEFRDITEQKRSEQNLIETEEKQRAMIANIADVIAIIDEDGINRYKSPNIENWFGWKPEEIIGSSTWENIHPDDLDHTQEVFTSIMDKPDATVNTESRYRCKDGSYKWIEFTAINLLHEPAIRGVLLNYHDITERKMAENALKDSEKKFRSYIENAPYGIFIADEDWKYLEVNKTASILTGYSEDELLTMTGFDLIAAESHRNAYQGNYDVKNNGFATVELLAIRKDKTVYWIRMDAIKLSETRYIVFAGDITERKKAEYSLIESKMLAEESNRTKSEFLANMSHELRTPLTAIIGFSDILGSEMFGKLNEKQLGYAKHINNSGKHLLELINDVLDLSKIEAGKMELDCEKFPHSRVFEEIITAMHPMAGKKHIDLTLENEIKTTEIVADKMKFKQIMFNLLSNAIKFTPENGRVSIVTKQMDNDIHISVSDTGIGIPPDMQEYIFSPFTQVDSSNKRRYGGTGLGLALVKQFVEMHNGKIWVKSEEGKGSTFIFTIGNQNI